MHINLFDPPQIRENLLPFTFTRPVACIRVGILTIAEKWEKYGFHIGFETQDYLGKKFEALPTNVKVNGALCPSKELSEAVLALKANTKLVSGDTVLAVSGDGSEAVNFEGTFRMINQPWEIFQFNKEQIEADFSLITKGRISQPITDPHTVVYGKENVFLEEGATIRAAIINAENGPVYIGKNAHVHEGAIISGAFALCEGAHVNMGAKIKGDSTVGPHSKVGGEVSNSVIFGFSNKGHDGFLGNSVIGEWCNLGADTNTSNLKNNYAPVKLWNYTSERFVQTGLQFCGLMMGDHAKCGINTMFNTGTVVGVGSNIFGAGFPKNFIPSFSWGGSSGLITFQPRKFYEVAEAVMQRRGMTFDDTEKEIIDRIFEITTQYRTWDKK
ncbi:GlmU family protein [uncultured Roseivirga sp.]|uniref:GlmU family protein n=1 Tax=uncultured Roseivirga sp. TaxID=543088 RepID=UPI0030D75118|tara:strand:- start:2344 stop:3498 length:1155 start_codon:yes stop_codon:yes gene_type:complete